jgi:hypothetical protein
MENILSVSFVWILFLLWIPLFLISHETSYLKSRHGHLKKIIILRKITRLLKLRGTFTNLVKTGLNSISQERRMHRPV